jgi:hypothetical protein
MKKGWWIDAPRWGGAPPPEPSAKEVAAANMAEKKAKRIRTSAAPGWRLSASTAEAPPTPKGPIGSWDPKITYEAIGRASTSSDSIFIVNALNHHISFSRYDISNDYLNFLEQQAVPKNSDNEDWYILDLHRTKWYDLFNPMERAEALRALWGIIRYLTRSKNIEV